MQALSRIDWIRLWALALAWAILPALPALFSGGFIGHGGTDLYPSVWGMWAFADVQPGLPSWTSQLAAPDGMGFVYSSPIHGWAAWPLLPILGLTGTWNLLLLASRAGGVFAAHWAARAWGLKPNGALMAATVYGCSPFFHGYAVEGIVEGQTSWALPLWLGFLALGKHRKAGISFAVTVIGSWYMAATACILAAMMPRKAWRSTLVGLCLASPFLWTFLTAFPERELLDPSVRRMMGTQIGLWTPGLAEGLNPFAQSAWIGFAVFALAASQALRFPRYVVAALAFWLLSLGIPALYDLPLFSSLRFPYRLHAGTLVFLAFLAGFAVQDRRRGLLLVPLVLLEGLLLSPIEPILPHAEDKQPDVYRDIGGESLLDIPGPFARAPGLHNPSRPRARWFLYGQVEHGMSTPWVPDFNSVGATGIEAPGLLEIRKLDPHWPGPLPETIQVPSFIDHVVLHQKLLGNKASAAHQLLLEDGWKVKQEDNEMRRRYRR